jgi:hypothetical protein
MVDKKKDKVQLKAVEKNKIKTTSEQSKSRVFTGVLLAACMESGKRRRYRVEPCK